MYPQQHYAPPQRRDSLAVTLCKIGMFFSFGIAAFASLRSLISLWQIGQAMQNGALGVMLSSQDILGDIAAFVVAGAVSQFFLTLGVVAFALIALLD